MPTIAEAMRLRFENLQTRRLQIALDRRMYGSYDISDKNLRRLLEKAKQTDEIRIEINQPRVRDDVRNRIDDQVFLRKDKILSSLVGANVFDNFIVKENSIKGGFLRKIAFFLVGIVLALLGWFFLIAQIDVENYLRTFILFAQVKDLLFYLTIVGFIPIGGGLILLGRGIYNYWNDEKLLRKAFGEVDESIVGAFLFELRQAINQHIRTFSFHKQLALVITNGLEEGYDAAFEVDTPARKYAETLISKMSHGSIGVAGPRGTGKTTLLRASEAFTGTGQDRIFIQISAPVVYDARDFILYLYSAVCAAVIQKYDPKQEYEALLIGRGDSRRGFFNLHSFVFGILFIAILFGGIYLLSYIGELLFNNNNVVLLDTPINVSPEGNFLLFGVLIFLAGFWMAKIYANGITAALSVFVLSSNRKSAREILIRTYNERRKIRYQQTISKNASGKLNLTVLETSKDRGLSLQEYPMSLPEVTFSYRDFIVQLSNKLQFIIAIDELDKIEDPVQAQSFLNDLKNILALKNCFYLVSVSQNAMSSFELRGLPFRDAFDSTFDEIVHVEYLDYKTANLIINRRLIGVPEPFIELAYCLSGGLPRDLIRVMRKMIIGNIENGGDIDIELSAFQLLHDDLSRKLSATRHQIQENNWAFCAEDALTQIDALDDDYSVTKIKEVGQWFAIESKQNAKWQDNDFYKLKLLTYELGLYMLYLATLMEFFVKNRRKKSYANVAKQDPLFKGLVRPNASKSPIDMLVAARQRMSLNGEYALILMNKFREEMELQTFNV